MVHQDSESIDRCLDAVQEAIRRDPGLAEAWRASASDFFPDASRQGFSPDDRRSAERRHLEWFLIEHLALGERERRVESLLADGASAVGLDTGELSLALAGSHASLFEVTAVAPDGGMTIWDLAGLFECSITEVEASRAIQVGDLIIGRVFPVGGRRHHVSRAAAVWRDPRLIAALRADLEHARSARLAAGRGTLRLRQSDLEAMFLASAAAGVAADRANPGALLRLRDLLAKSEVSAEEVESILERLAAEAPDPGRVLPGGGDLLGAILDDLAFETGVDLDAARVALLAAWHELHDARGESAPAHQESAADPFEAGASVPRDVASAVAEFDRKRRAGAPLEEAIRELERDLDLDSAESGGLDDSDGPAPDFPGVVGAMVEEFLWDEERQGGRAAADKARILRGLGRSAAELSLFESLGSRELVDYACRWSIEVDRLREPTDAERLVDALARFCAWAEENHDVPLQRAMAEILPRLRASLPRLARANRACTAEPVERAGAWYAFEQRRGASEAELVDLKGAPSEANVDPEVLEHLRPGDWIRGRREGPEFHVAACHPHELRPILGQ